MIYIDFTFEDLRLQAEIVDANTWNICLYDTLYGTREIATWSSQQLAAVLVLMVDSDESIFADMAYPIAEEVQNGIRLIP